MEFLILIYVFESEKGKKGLSLNMLIDDNIIHPAVGNTTVILHKL